MHFVSALSRRMDIIDQILHLRPGSRAPVSVLQPVLWLEHEMPSRSSCVSILGSLADSSALGGCRGQVGAS